MLRVALRGLAGRKLRAALTALAIVLGVAMVSGTYVLTDTIKAAFDNLFTDSYAGTSVVVSGKDPGIEFQGDTDEAPPVEESLLARLRGVDGVDAAVGGITDDAQLVDKKGKAIETEGAPTLAFGIDASEPRFNPLKLTDGRWPAGSEEIVIDKGTADDEGYAVGDTIGVSALGPVERYRIVGVAKFGTVDSIGSATFAIFDIATAQRIFDKEGKLDGIQLAAEPGIAPEELKGRVEEMLPANAVARTAEEQAADDSEETSEALSFFNYFLLAFAGIALFVGAFVIFNTLSITVAQRTREFATLRTIGASRPQLLASVVVEAFLIGLLASVSGLFAGLGLAKLLNWIFVQFGLDLPQTGLVFAPRTIVVSLVVGVVVTLVAGLFPAVRATRVPPIAAVREGVTLPRSRLAPFAPLIAAISVALSVALLVYGMFTEDLATSRRLLTIAMGVLLLFVGVALVSARFVRPLAHWLGWPATRIGGAAGLLARENSRRNPGRTAATAAALMIGLALVTFVAVLGQGMRRSNTAAIEDQVTADYIVTSQDGFTPFQGAAGDAVEGVSGLETATSVRVSLARVADSDKYLTGIDPNAILDVYRFEWDEGSNEVLGRLGRDGAIVTDSFADDEDLTVGDSFPVLTPANQRLTLRVAAIYNPPPFYPLLGDVVIAKGAFDGVIDRPENQFVFVNVRDDPSDVSTRMLESALRPFPDSIVRTRGEFVEYQEEQIGEFLMFLYVLLALSVIVSLFGMVNTLVLSVFERTRELGLLRAVGMTRRQVRRMIRHESVVTALIGAALGLPLGIFLALLVTEALSQFGLQFAVPLGSLVAFGIVAVAAGMLAAILPARRAARLNVLQALQYE